MFLNEVTAIGLLGKDCYWRGTVTDSALRILIDIKSIFPHSSVYNLKVPHLFDEIDEVVRKMFGVNILATSKEKKSKCFHTHRK